MIKFMGLKVIAGVNQWKVVNALVIDTVKDLPSECKFQCVTVVYNDLPF